MPFPLYIVWSKHGIAPKCKINAGFKITSTTLAVASILIVLFAINLAPNGVNAASAIIPKLVENDGLVDEIDGSVGLEDFGHERYRRAAVTPLGKRLTTKLVAELGTRPRHLYSFGIGK